MWPEPWRRPVPDRPVGDGLEQLGQRMERGRRTTPVPRRPVVSEERTPQRVDLPTPAEPPTPAAPPPDSPVPVVSAETSPPSPVASGPPAPSARPGPTPAQPALLPDEPQANLAVRVRRSLDQRLDDLAYELRRAGVRSSKAELIELLLWELPPTVTPELSARLAQFRSVAGRR
jgi:hypothetical protein